MSNISLSSQFTRLCLSLSIVFNSTPGITQPTAESHPSCRAALTSDLKIEGDRWGLKFMKLYNSVSREEFPTTVGIEIEGAVPDFVSRHSMAQEIGKILSQYPGISRLRVSPYAPQTENHSQWISYYLNDSYYEMKVSTDLSVKPPLGQKPIELVSPILRTQEDIEIFTKILDSLKKEMGFKEVPKTGGVHVHLGFEKKDLLQLAALVEVFAGLELAAINHFKTKPSRMYYTRPTSARLLEYLDKNPATNLSLGDLISKHGGRYHNLNLMALTKHGTVEFRLFNSTVSASEIVYFVNFARGLVQAIREKDPRLLAFLNANQNKPRLDLEALAANLEIDIGDPQIFASGVRRWSDRLLPWRRTHAGIDQEQLDRYAYDSFEASSSSTIWPIIVGTSIGLLFLSLFGDDSGEPETPSDE